MVFKQGMMRQNQRWLCGEIPHGFFLWCLVYYCLFNGFSKDCCFMRKVCLIFLSDMIWRRAWKKRHCASWCACGRIERLEPCLPTVLWTIGKNLVHQHQTLNLPQGEFDKKFGKYEIRHCQVKVGSTGATACTLAESLVLYWLTKHLHKEGDGWAKNALSIPEILEQNAPFFFYACRPPQKKCFVPGLHYAHLERT